MEVTLTQFLTDMAVIISNSSILTITLKFFVLFVIGLSTLVGCLSFKDFIINRFVPKDIRPFYSIVLFILAPLLLISPTYWFEPLSLEVSYVFFYAAFYMVFLTFAMLFLYFSALYWKFVKRRLSGRYMIDTYPVAGGTVLAVLFLMLFLGINITFY